MDVVSQSPTNHHFTLEIFTPVCQDLCALKSHWPFMGLFSGDRSLQQCCHAASAETVTMPWPNPRTNVRSTEFTLRESNAEILWNSPAKLRGCSRTLPWKPPGLAQRFPGRPLKGRPSRNSLWVWVGLKGTLAHWLYPGPDAPLLCGFWMTLIMTESSGRDALNLRSPQWIPLNNPRQVMNDVWLNKAP